MAEVVKYAANLPLDKTPNQMVGEHGCAATISVQVCEWETRINGTISVQTITPKHLVTWVLQGPIEIKYIAF